jgi:N-acetylgalactosamine-N,N'-diacetylbacillosaminyl-diphospho-undecaprenol 4-alpha-N-acetylgalactosaminyltransferase
LEGGGAERVVSILAESFLDDGHDVNIVCFYSGVDYSFSSRIKLIYLERLTYKWQLLFLFPRLCWRYKLFLKNEKVDVSISFLNQSNYINVLSKIIGSGVRTILNERSNPSSNYDSISLKGIINTKLIKVLYPRADGILANSRGNRDDLIKNFNIPRQRIEVVNNPIDFRIVENVAVEPYHYEANFFNLVSVGRLNRDKNHRLLIDAIYKLNNKNIRLYIFGKGPFESELHTLIRDKDLSRQVFLMGYKSDVISYMKRADCFVFASLHEGFPNVLVEAMACGLPIITSNCPYGPAEILQVEEQQQELNIRTKYGILVPLNNLSQMVAAIDEMYSNDSFRQECQENVYKRSIDFNAKGIFQMYKSYICV